MCTDIIEKAEATGPFVNFRYRRSALANASVGAALRGEDDAEIRRMIVRLELAPGAIIRDESLREVLGLGRTPIREALQRLVRDQFVTVIPRRGMYVSSIDVGDLALLYETRAILEPYAMRLACVRGVVDGWDEMAAVLEGAQAGSSPDRLLAIDPVIAYSPSAGTPQYLAALSRYYASGSRFTQSSVSYAPTS